MIFNLLHIFLAFNLLISSVGITANEHICQKKGRSIAFFLKPNSCCTPKKKSCCSSKKIAICSSKSHCSKENTFSKKPCCEDKTHYKKLNVSATEITKIVFSEIQPFFYYPVAGISLSDYDFIGENEKTVRFYLYRPPPLHVENLRVLYQSFLC